MITFRLVHSVPNPAITLGGVSLGVGTLTGGFTQLTLLAGSAVGVGNLLGAISVEGNLLGAPAGIGTLIGELAAALPGIDYIPLLEDI